MLYNFRLCHLSCFNNYLGHHYLPNMQRTIFLSIVHYYTKVDATQRNTQTLSIVCN